MQEGKFLQWAKIIDFSWEERRMKINKTKKFSISIKEQYKCHPIILMGKL
jgi:hypothetical protein